MKTTDQSSVHPQKTKEQLEEAITTSELPNSLKTSTKFAISLANRNAKPSKHVVAVVFSVLWGIYRVGELWKWVREWWSQGLDPLGSFGCSRLAKFYVFSGNRGDKGICGSRRKNSADVRHIALVGYFSTRSAQQHICDLLFWKLRDQIGRGKGVEKCWFTLVDKSETLLVGENTKCFRGMVEKRLEELYAVGGEGRGSRNAMEEGDSTDGERKRRKVRLVFVEKGMEWEEGDSGCDGENNNCEVGDTTISKESDEECSSTDHSTEASSVYCYIRICNENDGKETLVEYCKALCEDKEIQNKINIESPEEITEWLDHDERHLFLANEPECIIIFTQKDHPNKEGEEESRIGGNEGGGVVDRTLTAFNIWQIRLSQIFHWEQGIKHLTEWHFNRILQTCAKTEKRFGK